MFQNVRRQRPFQPGIEPTVGHVQNPCHNRYRGFEPPRFPERVPGSDSLAKDAVALFKLSRSRRTSATSLRSRLPSASNSGTERAPGAAIAEAPLALETQFVSVPFGIDHLFAASA